MKLAASIAAAALAIGMSAAAGASAETCSCRTAAHHSPQRAANRTIIVEDYYRHAPRRPPPQAYAPPQAYSPPSPDIYYEQGAYDYAPYLASYGYGGYGGYVGYDDYRGYGAYGGYRDYGRPYSGWYSHVGGGARWGGARGVGGPIVVGRGPGVRRVVGGFGGARVGGHAMVGDDHRGRR